ncbi:hypothetical protein IAT38_007558 [Cryptococcus sp. DSM 104549]
MEDRSFPSIERVLASASALTAATTTSPVSTTSINETRASSQLAGSQGGFVARDDYVGAPPVSFSSPGTSGEGEGSTSRYHTWGLVALILELFPKKGDQLLRAEMRQG